MLDIQLLFICFSAFLFIFVFWNEGKKDGFDKYLLFDLIFSLSVLSILTYIASTRWLYSLQVFHYDSIFLKIDHSLLIFTFIYVLWILGIGAFAEHFRWSVYRLLDIFTISLMFMVFPIVSALTVKTHSLVFFELYIPYLIIYKLVFSKRSTFGFISGLSFISLNLVNFGILVTLYSLKGRLPIAFILLTISVVTVFFRKKLIVSNTNLTKGFIDFIKNQLKSKDQELIKQENQIKDEDPYLKAGRAQEGSEDMDDAILEDNLKEITDARLGLVRSMRVQIKRALAFLKMGKYGICEICGKPIDPARLKVYPEATTCVEHASKSNR